MEKLKKYKNSIWRVPLIAVIAGFFYTPIYIRSVIRFGIIEPGVIDRRVSLLTSAGILAAVLVLGGMILLRKQPRKEIFISAAVVSAYGMILLPIQLLIGATTGSAAVIFMYLGQPLEWTGLFLELSLFLKERFEISISAIGWLRFLVPFLFVLFGRKTGECKQTT